MATELVAPDYDGFDNATVALVSLDGIITVIPILVAPENVLDYAGTRSASGVS